MEPINNGLVIGLLTLILGLVIGYVAGTTAAAKNVPYPSASIPSGMHGAMSGMMADLDGRTGAALERAFLDGMIVHHEGAVEMARTLLAGTKRPEFIKLANDIIAAQANEIDMMRQWRRN
ncbi:DUF305 domain-containing protein [Candidatus Parcubacteria bacterium]|nr:MAG: DUF305 domain-containing protein [Candidatus Parcubacteria bacterium]